MERYQVKDWQVVFENDRSRVIDECRWFCCPNKNGMGKRFLLSRPNGHKKFACFILICQALSRQRRPRDGWLTFDGSEAGVPWTTEVIADVCSCDRDFVGELLFDLSCPEVGWLSKSSNNNRLGGSNNETGVERECVPVALPDKSLLNGIEEKRIEEKRREESAATSAAHPAEVRKPEAEPTSPKARQPTADNPPKPEAPSVTKPRRQPTGPHAELIAHFTAGWEARYGAKFPFSAKDAAHAKWILNQVNDLEQAKSAVSAYLASNDEFYTSDRHGLGLLVAQFRRFVAARKPVTAPLQRARIYSS